MEIHNISNKGFFNRLKGKTFFINLLLVISISCISLSLITFGAYLNKTGQTTVLRMFFQRVYELNFSFIQKYIQGSVAQIENFYIDVKFEDWEKIRYLREQALSNGLITPEMKEEISAELRFNGNAFPAKISIAGLTIEHLKHPTKWSLSVKLKGDKTIMGMRKFGLLFPQSRGYLTDFIATEMLKSQDIIGLRSDFVNVVINGKDNGLYYLEERFDKQLIEHNHYSEGIIFKISEGDLDVYGLKKISKDKELSSQLIRLKKLIDAFLSDDIPADKIFDIKKMATFYVVSDMLNQKHALFPSNMRLYFNPITSLIEPIGREWGYLRKETQSEISLSIEKPNSDVEYHVALSENPILIKIFNSFVFEEAYISQAKKISNIKFLDEVLNEKADIINRLLKKIYKQNPFYIFPKNLLYKNQEYIRNKINNQLPCIDVFIEGIMGSELILLIQNQIDLPIEIHHLKYNSTIEIIPTSRLLMKSNYKAENDYQKVKFSLSNNIKASDFSTDYFEVYYTILGMDKVMKVIVFDKKMEKDDYLELNTVAKSSNIHKFQFLDVDYDSNIIKFNNLHCDLERDLIIPKGFTVLAIPGCEINLSNSARIISYSPILFYGNSDSPISIISSDHTGQGVIVYNCQETSVFNHVNFENLSNISDIGWSLRGAVTFYESPVNISNCIFNKNIQGDDYLNIVRTNYNIMNTTFTSSNSDAFDSDFSIGTMTNVNFYDSGNDAIDISGSNTYLNNINIINAGDKAISAGEKSNLICININISGGEIGIACKDNSLINIDSLFVESTKLAYCAFQKKSEYGPAEIVINNAISRNVQTEYLVEIGSSLILNDKEISVKSENVKKMLYGVEYGKSSK